MKLKKISQKCYYVPTLCWKFPSGKSRMLFVLLSFPIKWNRKICVMLLSSCNVHMQTVFPFLARWCKLKREWYQTEQLRSNHETTTCGGFIYPIAQLLLKPPMGSFGHLVCTVCTSSFCPGAVSWISAFLTDDYFVCIGLIYAEMGKITVSFFSPRFSGVWNKSSCNCWRHRYAPQASSFSTTCRLSSWRRWVRLWVLLNMAMDLQIAGVDPSITCV